MHEGIGGYIVKRDNEALTLDIHYCFFKSLLILNIWDYSSFSLCFSTTKFSYTKHTIKLGKEMQKRIRVDIL